jgi:hypothetical protein
MVTRRTIIFVVLGFSIWGILATGMVGYYYLRLEDTLQVLQELQMRTTIKVDLLIDYGNGTLIWCNETELTAGSTAFDALVSATSDVQYENHTIGKLITSINGQKGGENSAWLWFFWDTGILEWTYSLEAIDNHLLHPDDILKFEFTSW